ncbi:MAG TPA: GNAT family N-acetyltransferase, partial [Chloroflexota bacterium]
MPLTVLSVAFPFARVGPDAVGGAEQVLALLDRALVRAGHTSLVIARLGSTTHGTLLAVAPPAGPLDDRARELTHAAVRERIHQALATYPVDVVHLHGLDFPRYAPERVPTLATLHLDPGLYDQAVFAERQPNLFLQCVSCTQRSACPPGPAQLIDTIANGVPLDEFVPGGRKSDFALSLGRICPEKGFHLAADAAREAGVPLVLAGQVYPYPAHEQYFFKQLQSRLNNPAVHFIGPVGMPRKRRLLALARCLLVPSQTRETSSLVAMEALACGTPVIAFRAGALPEIVEHGRTGFVVDSVAEMAEALHRVAAIEPRDCRRSAEERFSAERMAARYLACYERLAEPPGSVDPLQVTEATSLDDLRRARSAWLELWQRSPTASIFQHPDWLIPWCVPFGVRQPWVLLLHRAGRLVGVAPLVRYERGRQRVLTLLGAGISDDQDVLLEGREAAACMALTWAYLERHHHRFDVCELENLAPDSPLLHYEPSTAWRGGHPIRQHRRPVLRLPVDATSLDNIVPGGLRKEARYLERRAARDGLPISVSHATRASFDRHFGEFVALHRARWTDRGQPGMLSPDLTAFHHEVARRLLDSDCLRLSILRLAETPAAAFYGFHAHGRTVYYLGGFEPALRRYSPGTLVVWHALQQALTTDRATAFDFLRG